jgi:hypothetical protein
LTEDLIGSKSCFVVAAVVAEVVDRLNSTVSLVEMTAAVVPNLDRNAEVAGRTTFPSLPAVAVVAAVVVAAAAAAGASVRHPVPIRRDCPSYSSDCLDLDSAAEAAVLGPMALRLDAMSAPDLPRSYRRLATVVVAVVVRTRGCFGPTPQCLDAN